MSTVRSDTALASVRDHYLARFERFSAEAEKTEDRWLTKLRADAMRRFQSLGFPTTKHEDWRYTNVAAIAKAPLELAGTATDFASLRPVVEASRIPNLDAALLVFVNGRFVRELSDDADGRFDSLAAEGSGVARGLDDQLGSCATSDDAFSALNTAFFADGALLRATARDPGDRVLHLLFVSTGGGISHPRVLISSEPNSRMCVVQDHVQLDDDAPVTNVVTEVQVGANSAVDLVLLQRESGTGRLFTSTHARQDRGSRFAIHTLTLGGALVRNELATVLDGEGAECELRGLFFGEGARHIDNHTLVDHAVPHCKSDELYKGVLGDESRGVFRGRVLVRKDAQKTDALQSNPNLLLSDRAEIDTRPQLEIYADDVKCSHGSSIGRLDPNALFYLRSRGIGEAQARKLLTQGFVFEITAALPRPVLAEYVRALLFSELEATSGVDS